MAILSLLTLVFHFRRVRWRWFAALLAVLLVAYAFPSLNEHKNPFFGLACQCVFLFGLILLALEAIGVAFADVRTALTAALTALLFYGGYKMKWPAEDRFLNARFHDVNTRLSQAIADDLGPNVDRVTVFLSEEGHVTTESQRWEAQKAGRRNVFFTSQALEGKWLTQLIGDPRSSATANLSRIFRYLRAET